MIYNRIQKNCWNMYGKCSKTFKEAHHQKLPQKRDGVIIQYIQASYMSVDVVCSALVINDTK